MKEIIIEVPDRFGQELKPEKANCEIKGELVRCKDCKHHLECDYWIENGDDWFCADGKRTTE